MRLPIWALGFLTGGAAASAQDAPPAAADSAAHAAVAPILNRIGAVPDAKSLLDASRGAPAALEAAALDAAGRAAGLREVRGAVLAARDRLDAVLRKKTEASFRSQIPRLKAELAKRRESAVGLIQDEINYPEGAAGKAVQPRVDEKVAAVREAWETPLLALARLTPSVAADLEALNRATAEALEAAGAPPEKETGLRLDTLFADPGDFARLFQSTPVGSFDQKLSDHNRKTLAANAQVQGLAPEVQEEIALTNAYREMMGRKALQIDAKLTQAAQAHAAAMARQQKCYHQGEDGTPASRILAAGYDPAAIAENVTGRLDTAREAHEAWYRSAGHHRTLIDPQFHQIGVGFADGYWTQNFGRAKLKTGGETK